MSSLNPNSKISISCPRATPTPIQSHIWLSTCSGLLTCRKNGTFLDQMSINVIQYTEITASQMSHLHFSQVANLSNHVELDFQWLWISSVCHCRPDSLDGIVRISLKQEWDFEKKKFVLQLVITYEACIGISVVQFPKIHHCILILKIMLCALLIMACCLMTSRHYLNQR